MSRTVIPWNQLPAQLPIQTTALVYLLLKHFDAPGWVCGVVGTMLVLLWVLAVVRMYTDKPKPLPGYGTDAK
jgi:hypothetical protein